MYILNSCRQQNMLYIVAIVHSDCIYLFLCCSLLLQLLLLLLLLLFVSYFVCFLPSQAAPLYLSRLLPRLLYLLLRVKYSNYPRAPFE